MTGTVGFHPSLSPISSSFLVLYPLAAIDIKDHLFRTPRGHPYKGYVHIYIFNYLLLGPDRF